MIEADNEVYAKGYEDGMAAESEVQKTLRPWVGLTDEEIWETISRIGTSDSDVNPYAKLADARAIEAKLMEKNR
jgi:adenylyl- and sulfurtransferase ThiI